jgi:Trk-type K+ transport system membrane component
MEPSTYNPIFQQIADHGPGDIEDEEGPIEMPQNESFEIQEEGDEEIRDYDHRRQGFIHRTLSRTRSNSSSNIEYKRRRNSETAFNIANTIRDESMNFLQRRKEEVDQRLLTIPLQEIQQVKIEFLDTLVGRRKFHIAWTLWVVGFSVFGGGLIAIFGNHSFVDSWFTAASAICNAGLNVISSEYQPKESLAVLAILMMLGGSSVMLLPTMSIRALLLRRYRSQMKECLVTIQSSPSSYSLTQFEHLVHQEAAILPSLSSSPTATATLEGRESLITSSSSSSSSSISSSSNLKNILIIVADYYKLYDALVVAIWIVFLYTFLWIFFGTLFIYIGLLFQPLEPVLEKRGISRIENAIFFSISSFTNSGLSISQNGLFYVTDNDFVLFISSILILVGNTLMPVLLRYFIAMILWIIRAFILPSSSSLSFSSSLPTSPTLHSPPELTRPYRIRGVFGIDWYRLSDALEYILLNPRRICTHMFTQKDSLYLLQFAILCNLVEYFFFIVTCLPRPAIEKDGSYGKLFKLGLFQTLNTRHAGFGVFDLRTFPQDMLFVMALSMFLSSIPYISLLGNTATEGMW